MGEVDKKWDSSIVAKLNGQKNPQMDIRGETLEITQNYKYLGLDIHENLR